MGGKVTFTGDTAYIHEGKKSIVLAKRGASGLYFVVNNAYSLSKNGTAEGYVGSLSTDLARERVIALHRAFGHASVSTLKNILKHGGIGGVTVEHLKLLPPCEACMLGKAHRAHKSRKAGHKAEEFAYRLCADCTGPFRTRSVGGCYYLLVVVARCLV